MMKRIFALLLTVFMVVAFAACRSRETELTEEAVNELRNSLIYTNWERRGGLLVREIIFSNDNQGVWTNNGGGFVWDVSSYGYLTFVFTDPIIRTRGNTYSYDFVINSDELQLVSRNRRNSPTLIYTAIEEQEIEVGMEVEQPAQTLEPTPEPELTLLERIQAASV